MHKKMYMAFLTFHLSTLSVPPPPLDVCAAHGEAVSLGRSPGEWLGFRGDVLGPGPPQRERHGRTWLSQSRLAPEEALLQQRHRSSQVPTLWRISGT